MRGQKKKKGLRGPLAAGQTTLVDTSGSQLEDKYEPHIPKIQY